MLKIFQTILLILLVIHITISITNNDIQLIGSNFYLDSNTLSYGAIGISCGYYNDRIYFIGGILHNTDYIWNGREHQLFITKPELNINDYSNIIKSWSNYLITSNEIDIIKMFPGFEYQNGKYYCYQSDCSYQLNMHKPYIYIVGPITFNNNNERQTTSSMIIYDMSISSWIESDKYTYTIPNGPKQSMFIHYSHSVYYKTEYVCTVHYSIEYISTVLI